jgi:serine/threonine protein kinase
VQGELTGERLGNYRLESVLGRGGMGVVYRAEQTSLGRTVAVKVIAPALSQDPMLRSRFKREAQLAASLDHPNVLPIYEADEANGLLYIAMRYVDGVDLGEMIRERHRLSAHEAAATVMQIAGALDAAHSRGLVHRDVKPANVLLAGEITDVAYLTDFGLTKHVGAVSGPTQSGQFVGTPDYAAPEQIKGHAVNAATDVYALGCVLHEALTGTVPFPRESNVAKMYAHISDPPPRPSDLADGVSPALDEVVARALSKEPGDRHPSAGDLGRAAVAAAADRRAPSNEHSVAVGEAAVPGSAPPPAPGKPVRVPATRPSPANIPTAHLPQESAPIPASPTPPAVHVHRAGDGRRSRGLIAVAVLSVLALLAAGGVAAFVISNGSHKAVSGQAASASTGGGSNASLGGTQVPTTPSTQAKTTPSGGSTAWGGGGRLPAESKATMTTEIRDLLRRFYQKQIDHDFPAVWRLTTARYRQEQLKKTTYSQWVINQGVGAKYFQDAQNIDVSIFDPDPGDGSVAVNVTGMRYVQSGSPCTMWEGVTWAKYERGSWHDDAAPDATTPRRAKWGNRGLELIGEGNHCIVFH